MTIQMTREDVLMHYGVKGMKWGRRRGGSDSGGSDSGGSSGGGGGKAPSARKAANQKMKDLQRKSMDAEDRISSAKTPAEKAKAQRDFDEIGKQFDQARIDRNPKKAARQAKNAEIKAARERQVGRLREFEEAQGEFMAARTNKGTEKAERVMRQKEMELYTSEDAKKASEWTTGELAVNAIGVGALIGLHVGANLLVRSAARGF